MGQMTEGGDATRHIEREAAAIRAERARIKAAETELERRTKALIDKVPTDVTIRELAALVALSPQRVAQLAPGRSPRGRRPKATEGTETP